MKLTALARTVRHASFNRPHPLDFSRRGIMFVAVDVFVLTGLKQM